MRHAKSSKSSLSSDVPDDRSRPLNKRGKRDAPRVAARLTELGWAPQQVLCSDAQRTRETWDRMKTDLDSRVEAVTFVSALYGGGVDEARATLATLPRAVRTAMIIGHNPGWEAFVEWLCSTPTCLTTANAALLTGEGETWEQALARPGGWELLQVVRPKELDE